jgi:hypothetical protein
MEYRDMKKKERRLIKKIDKLFDWKYIFDIDIRDDWCTYPKFGYKLTFHICEDGFYWSFNRIVYQWDNSDLDFLIDDFIKYIKKSIKDWFFYQTIKSKYELIPNYIVKFSDLKIDHDYKN